ncbi:MAG: hypothetical protein JOZ33_04100 [Acidobacteriaceae bacterium]|nr:hypothetical protein [Acidobacteriaceae bacterium]
MASDPSVVASLPTPPPPASANTYTGSQSPGQWSLNLDDSKNTFSYQALTYPASPNTPVSGSLQNTNGFLNLGTSNGTSLGYVLEVQGRTAVFRPGDSTIAPVMSVPQTSCYPITGRLRFQFIAMQAGPYPSSPAGGEGSYTGSLLYYGSFVASTNSDGSSWQFGNLQGSSIAVSGEGSGLVAGISGPLSFMGSCKASNGQASIAISGTTVFNGLWAPSNQYTPNPPSNTVTTLDVGPTGFFALDQSVPSTTPPTGGAVIGVVEPSSPLSTSDIEAGNYLGFLYEPENSGVVPVVPGTTAPVAFGAGLSNSLVGGSFPNDDVTQAPGADITISLGKQDSTLNGLYASASITVLDPFQNCANYTGSGTPGKPGINDQGYITCTFPAIAVVGNPEGKYAIFINSYNWAAQLAGVPMQLYLYQQ